MSAYQFTDYEALCQTVERWLARDDLADDVRGFIWLAECDVQREVRVLFNDKIATGATIGGQEYISLPDDYAGGGLLRFTGDTSQSAIEVVSLNMLDDARIRGATYTTPVLRVGSIIGSRIYIGPQPGGALDYELIYKAGVQHLSEQVRTNRLLQLYPDCLLFGALVCSAPFLKDDTRLSTWVPLYTNAKDAARRAEEDTRLGFGPLRMRSDVVVY